MIRCPLTHAFLSANECPKLIPPYQGVVNIDESGGVATFTCHQGYYLIGSQVLLCEHGKWMGVYPFCIGRLLYDCYTYMGDRGFLIHISISGSQTNWRWVVSMPYNSQISRWNQLFSHQIVDSQLLRCHAILWNKTVKVAFYGLK